MPALTPLIAGLWNGHSLWLQWTPAPEAPDGYRVEISIRDTEDEPVKWKLIDAGKSPGIWMVIPIWRCGAIVQARVSVNGIEGEPEMAGECVFRRSSCVFGFQAGRKPLFLEKGDMIHAQVDAAAASYMTQDPIEVAPGEMARATLHSLTSCGFAQLDHEGHFELRPGAGARIWNLEPSTNDVEATGREFTVLAVMERDGPYTLVRKPHNPNRR